MILFTKFIPWRFILGIQFGLFCWGIELIISNQHPRFCYRTAMNLGMTRHISINNVNCNSMYSFLHISFDTDISSTIKLFAAGTSIFLVVDDVNLSVVQLDNDLLTMSKWAYQ